jgi:hypothetical protein
VLLGIQNVTDEVAKDTINILLKYQSDIAKAAKELSSQQSGFKQFAPGPK